MIAYMFIKLLVFHICSKTECLAIVLSQFKEHKLQPSVRNEFKSFILITYKKNSPFNDVM